VGDEVRERLGLLQRESPAMPGFCFACDSLNFSFTKEHYAHTLRTRGKP
jgi:hypothetical protein